MKNADSIRRILLGAVALVALAAVAIGASTWAPATDSAPLATVQSATAAPAQAPAAAAGVSAQTAASASPATAASAALGKQSLQSRCIGRCHQDALLDQRLPANSAATVVASMGQQAGLNTDQQAAVVAYFAQ